MLGDWSSEKDVNQFTPRRYLTYPVDSLHQFLHLLGADVGTEGEPKVENHPLAKEVLVGAFVAMVVGEPPVASQIRLAHNHLSLGSQICNHQRRLSYPN